ncbi:imidazole glycerol phosphate synthase subunit HisF [Aerococcaceae bacterium DSM 109653]|uniref:Imidazole glycerol phosphate synthase subunit HisF n=1 Tax=Fundicoccus ignavus TaxID=2664442 RepID=A0A844BTC8_9LACT|nr:imidazole glycerol phosphate synthase cyclase subunit [Fundicoccus ignavus]MRI81193.1 imidazole glycerol phosphate synthase subunit HisF [Fundicoccus ignavus]
MKKIIPCLDTKHGHLVKGVNFLNMQHLGDPVEYAKKYSDAGADELVVLDIAKTLEQLNMRVEMVEEILKVVDIPVTVGGGLASIEEIDRALATGISGIAINSAAVLNPDLINQTVAKYGSERLTLAVDVSYDETKGDYYVYTHGGQKQVDLKAFDWLKECEARGAGRLLITSIDHDGVKTGFDIKFLKAASELVDLPIIASGGAGNVQHFVELFEETGVEGGLAASIFHRDEITIQDVKDALATTVEGVE